MDQTELDSIDLCRAGNLQAFDTLYVRHVDAVYKFLFRRTHDRQTAEDLTSMTFLKALESIRSFNPRRGELLAWLYRIARNTLIDHYRRFGKEIVDLELIENLPADDTVTKQAEQSIDAKAIQTALAHLKPLQRDVVLLRIWEGLSYKEIADITGKTEGNCKLMFFRAMAQLKTVIAIPTLLLLAVSGRAFPSLL